MITCTTCKTEIHPLAVFPGEICLDCHARKFDSAPQPTAQEIANMWRSPNLFKYDPEFLEYTEDLDRCRLQCVCSEEEKAFGD